jgi:hypothetical protein
MILGVPPFYTFICDGYLDMSENLGEHPQFQWITN